MPQPLGTLFDVKCKMLEFDTLAALSKEQLVKYAFTPEQSIRIVELTKSNQNVNYGIHIDKAGFRLATFMLSQRRICSARQGLWYRGFVSQKRKYFK